MKTHFDIPYVTFYLSLRKNEKKFCKGFRIEFKTSEPNKNVFLSRRYTVKFFF